MVARTPPWLRRQPEWREAVEGQRPERFLDEGVAEHEQPCDARELICSGEPAAVDRGHSGAADSSATPSAVSIRSTVKSAFSSAVRSLVRTPARPGAAPIA